MARKNQDLTPKQARNYPSLTAWLASEANTEWLKGLMADPRFLAVCHYATQIHKVTSEDLIGPAAALPEVIVRKAALHAGASEFVQTLRTFIVAKSQQTAEPEPWSHIHPEP